MTGYWLGVTIFACIVVAAVVVIAAVNWVIERGTLVKVLGLVAGIILFVFGIPAIAMLTTEGHL